MLLTLDDDPPVRAFDLHVIFVHPGQFGVDFEIAVALPHIHGGDHIPDSPNPRDSPRLLAKARSISSERRRIMENGLELKRSRDG